MSAESPSPSRPAGTTTRSEPPKVSLYSRRTSLHKALTWRCIGSVDTFAISWLVSGVLLQAGIVAIAEFLTKPLLFYFHERLWSKVHYGLHQIDADCPSSQRSITRTGEQKKRSWFKAITWRISATLDTTLISLLVTGSLPIAVTIGSLEMLTKTVLYYYHERLWNHYRPPRTPHLPPAADQSTGVIDDGRSKELNQPTNSVSWSMQVSPEQPSEPHGLNRTRDSRSAAPRSG